MRRLMTIVLVAGTAIGAFAQTAGAPQAPTDRAIDFSDGSLDAAAQQLVADGLITRRMLEGGTFSINVRRIAGAETALSHPNITEVWVVRDGSGVVSTGGSLVDPEPGNGPGELRGRSIKGGAERTISAGDLVFIPPNVPHGIKESKGITYLNIRFQTPAQGR